jgi:hypothetical protein
VSPQTSTPGRPPATAPRSGARPDSSRGHAVSEAPAPGSTRWAAEQVGCTFRQADYWIRHGLMGTALAAVGSGKRRRFDDHDLEVLAALRHLASLGAIEHWLRLASAAVRAERVRPGELLVVTIAGHTLRCGPSDVPRVVSHGSDHHAAWLVRLQAFDGGRPLSLARPEGGGGAVAESRPLPASSAKARHEGRPL